MLYTAFTPHFGIVALDTVAVLYALLLISIVYYLEKIRQVTHPFQGRWQGRLREIY